jgi:hypothetical protein
MRRLLATAALAALTLGTAACGDDDTSSSPTRPETSATQEAGAEDVTTDAPDDTATTQANADDAATDDTEAPETTETTATTATTADEPTAALSEECEVLKAEFEERFDADSTFADFAEAFEDVKAITPDDIDDDLDVLSGAYDDLAQLIEDSGGDLAEAMTDPEVLERMEALNSPEVQEASANVEEFFEEACPDVG